MPNFFKSRSKTLAKVMGRSVVKPLLILESLETIFASGIKANPKFREKARSFVEIHDADHDIS
jgi:hypothetical protein